MNNEKWLKSEDYDGYKLFRIIKCDYCGEFCHDESEKSCPQRVKDAERHAEEGKKMYGKKEN